MPFIEHQEALGLPCPAEANVAPSIPFQPFPFLKLPREIRDSIYYYALIRPDTVRSTIPRHISSVQPRVSNPSRTSCGGTEKSTRLFRVNHQVSDEALELFYSSFPLYFPHYTDDALVNATLRETLSARARSLIGSIGFMIILRCSSGPSTHSEGEMLRQTLEAMVQLLPNVRRVELTVTFIGSAVPENEVKEVVTRAIRVTSPLKDIAVLVLRGASSENAQQMHIIREVREALEVSVSELSGSYGYLAFRPAIGQRLCGVFRGYGSNVHGRPNEIMALIIATRANDTRMSRLCDLTIET